MADLNPGERFSDCCCITHSGLYGGNGPQTPTDPSNLQVMANSRNHNKKGQNVLYADGHWSGPRPRSRDITRTTFTATRGRGG